MDVLHKMDAASGETTQLKLRSYQQEMLEESLLRNIIVAMDTGSGKTHIAIARILHELEHSNPTKLVWFMAPSLALSIQQHNELRKHLAAYNVITLTGNDSVDKWTDQRLWDAVLENVRVVVGTPAVLADALSHGFVRMSRLSLLVFDEAHRCIKNSPMNVIMKAFYHEEKDRGNDVPHILGLTASPVMNAKRGSLEVIEANLHAKAMTPKRERQTLERHVHPPSILSIPYKTAPEYAYPSGSPLCDALHIAARDYQTSNDPYILKLAEQGNVPSTSLWRKIPKTYCSTQIHSLSRRAATLYQQLGSSAAEWYIQAYIQRFKDSLQDMVLLPDISMKEQRHLMSIFRRIMAASQDNGKRSLPVTATDKVQQLLALLAEQKSPSVRAIVFVEQRATVSALSHILQLSGIGYSIGGFVGTSSFKSRNDIADLSESKQCQKDLDDFRNGEKNLIVATNVLEEGIDVSACNLVVCFDLPKNLVSFVQRRGRARQRVSSYCLFIADSDLETDPLGWQSLEDKMKKAYMSERESPERQDKDEDAANSRTYRVESTGALLTLENAKAHLHHFCAVSTIQANNYVDLRPEFITKEESGENPWTAKVTLPSFIHSELRTASSSQAWACESTAIKDAAFVAYIALHKKGLINNNLLPLVKDYGPERCGQLNKPSVIQVAERRVSWLAVAHSLDTQIPRWHKTTIRVEKRANTAGYSAAEGIIETSTTMLLYLPVELPQVDTFDIFWNQRIRFKVTLETTSEVSICNHDLMVMRNATYNLLSTIHYNRMARAKRDLIVLFCPLVDDLQHWVQTTSGCMRAPEYFQRLEKDSDCGLVRSSAEIGRSFIFDRVGGESDLESGDDQILVVKRFPKRRDFLHPIPERQSVNIAYTAEHELPLAACTVDRVPAQYATFSAFVPSIMHRIDIHMAAQTLQTTVLRDVGMQNTGLILEAISAPSAGEQHGDYNRLEYLGDAILKFCASLQVMAQHQTWPEGYLSLEKFRIVQNSTLTSAALDAGLDRFILTKPFTGAKWKPPYVSDCQIGANEEKKREISSKVLADVVEALVGAAFVEGGLEKAYRCIRLLLPNEVWFDHHIDSLTSALEPFNHTSLEPLEKLVGHRFRHPTLLVEAITHASLPFAKTGMSYERLEFFGDAVLDLIIVPKLFSYTGRTLKHWQLHNLHEALVNGLFLGFCCMSYSINDSTNSIVDRIVGEMQIQQRTRPLHLHDFLRAGGQLMHMKTQYLQKYTEFRNDIHNALSNDEEYPWTQLITFSPPKFFSDVVESVLGALYIDTNGDLATCERFVEKLGIIEIMKRLLDDNVETMSPKERLGIAAGNDNVEYLPAVKSNADGTRSWSCLVKVGDKEITNTVGCAIKTEAEVKAAHAALQVLKSKLQDTENGIKL